MIDISKERIEVNCPNCNHKIRVTLKQVINEDTINCASCSESIKLQDSNKSTQRGVKDINKAFSDFEKTLKSFGR